MVEFFVPKNNEKKLLETAAALGITDVVFLYTPAVFKDKDKIWKEQVACGIILSKNVTVRDVQKAKQVTSHVVVRAGKHLRMLLERCRGIYVYDVEYDERKDFIHHRNSGLDQVFSKLAKKNKIVFVFNFHSFLRVSDTRKGQALGRMEQNMMLFQKHGVSFFVSSFASDVFGIKNALAAFPKVVKSKRVEKVDVS